MLVEKEILEIREHLNNAASPLFYFDNDQDGLCSYLLLRRFIGKGAGVAVKTSPLDMNYYRRINEFNPDTVFILDQPTVSTEFFEALHDQGIKIVWIDHHENQVGEIPEYVSYYNPLYNETAENNPTTELCYQVSQRKEDIWLETIGCVADKFIPKHYSEFMEKYPDLGIDSDAPFEIFYNSQIGKIARILGVGLKDRTTNVVKMMRFLSSVKTPYEVLEETSLNQEMHKRFQEVEVKFKKFISRAKDEYDGGPILFFKYSGETSMSADIANKLSYLYPNIFIIVAFVKGARVNISIRGDGARDLAQEAIKEFPLATCGGHENAVGSQLDLDDLEKFVDNFEALL